MPDYPYIILIIWDTGSGKAKTFINLIGHQHNIEKRYLYSDQNKAKYQLIITKSKKKAYNIIMSLKLLFERYGC